MAIPTGKLKVKVNHGNDIHTSQLWKEYLDPPSAVVPPPPLGEWRRAQDEPRGTSVSHFPREQPVLSGASGFWKTILENLCRLCQHPS